MDWALQPSKGLETLKGTHLFQTFEVFETSKVLNHLHTSLDEGSQIFAGKQALRKHRQIKCLLGQLLLSFFATGFEDFVHLGMVTVDCDLVADKYFLSIY